MGTADDVVTFLLTGSDAPCCIQFGLERCEDELSTAFSGTPHTTALRALGRLRSTIEYADVPGATDPQLGDFIGQAEMGIREVSDCLLTDLFAATSVNLHPYEVV